MPDLSKDAIDALSFLAVGNYSDLYDYKNSHQVVIGKQCLWCTFNSVKASKGSYKAYDFSKHKNFCPTYQARRALSAAKVIMKSWKITYALVEDETQYSTGIKSEIRAINLPFPDKPDEISAKKKLIEYLCTDSKMYIIMIDLDMNIGYEADVVA